MAHLFISLQILFQGLSITHSHFHGSMDNKRKMGLIIANMFMEKAEKKLAAAVNGFRSVGKRAGRQMPGSGTGRNAKVKWD
jgi:hypothetical protein